MTGHRSAVTPDHLFLNISLRCNMSCSRCYGHLKDHNRPVLMDLSLAKQATDWYLQHRNMRCGSAYIMFFGGEPLLNWSLVEEYLPWYRRSYVREKVMICLFTNGLELMPDQIDFLWKYRVVLFVSLDGMEEVHRAKRDISSTQYRNVVEVIQAIVRKNPGSVIPYCVIDREHLPLLEEILETIVLLGVENIAIAKDFAQHWTQTEKDLLSHSLRQVQTKYPVGFFVYPEITSDCVHCSVKSIMVYPDGTVYDLCYVCASVLVQENRISPEQLDLFLLGNLAKNTRMTIDREAKKRLIGAHTSCPTLTTDQKLLSTLSQRTHQSVRSGE